MKIYHSIFVLGISIFSGCASYYDALGYKPSESGPSAKMNVINQNDSGPITAWIFTNPDCTGGMRIFSAPIAKGSSIVKSIDADRQLTFSVGGDAGKSDKYTQYSCVVYASFLPKAGHTYHLTYRGDGSKCSIGLMEQTASGQRQPVYLQKKTYRTTLTKNSCE